MTALKVHRGAAFVVHEKMIAEYVYEDGEALWHLYSDRSKKHKVATFGADGTFISAEGIKYHAIVKEPAKREDRSKGYHKKASSAEVLAESNTVKGQDPYGG